MGRRFDKQALIAAENLPRAFPELRPRGAEVVAFAEETAALLGEDDFHVPADLLTQGFELVDEGERRRIIELFAADQPAGWRRLVADLRGNPLAAERSLIRGAVRWLICERRDRPRRLLIPFEEDQPLPRLPGALVALVLEPSYLWSLLEASEVVEHTSVIEDDAGWVAAAEPLIAERVRPVHVDRVRALVRPLELQLPVRSLPRASKVLSRDVDSVNRDDDAAARAAALLLLGHAFRFRPLDLALSPN